MSQERKKLSKASRLLMRAPVCACVAAAPMSELPTFSTTSALPAACSRSAAYAKATGSWIDSATTPTTVVASSCASQTR
jgi:hypothetical protein